MKAETTLFPFFTFVLLFWLYLYIHNSFIDVMILNLSIGPVNIVNSEEIVLLLFNRKRLTYFRDCSNKVQIRSCTLMLVYQVAVIFNFKN